MSTVENAHSPAQMRTLSNVGHWVEGAVIAGAGLMMLRDARRGEGPAAATSRVLAGAGALLGLGLVGGSFHHGGPRRFFRADPQQAQHLQMAGLLTGGALAGRRGRTGALVRDLATARIGHLFLTHTQHGTSDAAARAVRRHRGLGAPIVGGAAATAVADTFGARAFRTAGAVLLIAAGGQLVAYREPEGAYEDGGGH